jgi:hypothetical protein
MGKRGEDVQLEKIEQVPSFSDEAHSRSNHKEVFPGVTEDAILAFLLRQCFTSQRKRVLILILLGCTGNLHSIEGLMRTVRRQSYHQGIRVAYIAPS